MSKDNPPYILRLDAKHFFPGAWEKMTREEQTKLKQEIERGYHPRATGPIKLYLFKHEALGEITENGRSKYEAVVAADRKWGVPWTRVAKEAEIILLAEEGPENEV